MIIISYAIVALILVFLSIKLSDYVDMLDKISNLSGAFIGGILLSAVTSLPELLTTVSSTAFLGKPEMSLGNILGSNLFNLAMLSTLILFTTKSFRNTKISKSHSITSILLCFVYGILLLNIKGFLRFEILTISVTSILILLAYIFSLRTMANDTAEKNSDEKDDEVSVTLTFKQIIFRFVFATIGLVIFSFLITSITDKLAITYNLGQGLAGALFLGVTTSLPELVSCIALVKKQNYNIAIGNVVGSCIFNFLILFIADLLYTNGSIYLFESLENVKLIIFGAIATPLMLLVLNDKKKKLYIPSTIGIISSYIAFLAI